MSLILTVRQDRIPKMSPREILKREFDAEDESFLMRARCELTWDGAAFRRLTSAMFDVASEERRKSSIETWIASGFWFIDSWIGEWTGHPHFPHPPEPEHSEAIQLIHDLCFYLFIGESPYEGDKLQKKAKDGEQD